jgi:hypothetical protein
MMPGSSFSSKKQLAAEMLHHEDLDSLSCMIHGGRWKTVPMPWPVKLGDT